MSRYAERTAVSTDRSVAEIRRTPARYGADQFIYGWDPGQAVLGFRVDGRLVRPSVPMPDRRDPEFWHTPERRRRRSPEQAYALWEQACRQRLPGGGPGG